MKSNLALLTELLRRIENSSLCRLLPLLVLFLSQIRALRFVLVLTLLYGRELQKLIQVMNLFYGTDLADGVPLEQVLLTIFVRADEFDFFQLKKGTLCLLIRASDNAFVSSRANQWTWLTNLLRANSLTLLIDAHLL